MYIESKRLSQERMRCSSKVVSQGKAISRRCSVDMFSSISADALKVYASGGLVVLRGNLRLFKDMAIVTLLGSKAKDNQSFSPIICGLQASRVSISDFTNFFLKRRKL